MNTVDMLFFDIIILGIASEIPVSDNIPFLIEIHLRIPKFINYAP